MSGDRRRPQSPRYLLVSGLSASYPGLLLALQGRGRITRRDTTHVRRATRRPDREAHRAHRRGAAQAGARHDDAAGRPRRGGGARRAAEPLRQQLPRPRQPPRDGRCRARGARPLGVRNGLREVHLRHAGAPPRAGGAPLGVPRHGRHDPVRLVLRRQRRRLRGAARRAGRRDLRPAEPRLDHRRHPPLQGASAPVRERRHGRARDATERGGGRSLPARGDRRRVLDGRLRRQARRDLRPRRAARRAGAGRRLARRRVRRPATVAARTRTST